MRKIITIILLFIVAYNASSQNYIEFKAGYGFALGGRTFTESQRSGTTGGANPNFSQLHKVFMVNYGKGYNMNFVYGLKLNDWITPEVGFHYSKTRNSWISQFDDYYVNSSVDPHRFEQLITTDIYSAMLSANYGVKFFKDVGENQFFMRIGIRTSMFTKYRRNYYVNHHDTYTNSGNQYQWEYYHQQLKTGGISFGANLSMGYCWKLTERRFFVIEAYATAMNWSPKHLEMIRYEVNGDDRVPDAPEDHLHSIYKDELIGDQDNSISAGGLVADYSLKEIYPWSTWGIRAGFQFRLGKKWN